MAETKICSKCKTPYPATLEYFYAHKLRKDGLRSECKKCYREIGREYQRTPTGKATQKKAFQKYYASLDGYLRCVFHHIKQRCNNPDCKAFKYYGGRGIQNKFKSFDEFFRHIIELRYDTLDKIKGLEIDRINNNGDYEIGNIRFVTSSENSMNSRKQKIWRGRKCTSRYKGVHWDKARKKWVAGIGVNNYHYYLGCSSNEAACARTYDTAALRYFGSYALTNADLGLVR